MHRVESVLASICVLCSVGGVCAWCGLGKGRTWRMADSTRGARPSSRWEKLESVRAAGEGNILQV
jgi:hypothetical protein